MSKDPKTTTLSLFRTIDEEMTARTPGMTSGLTPGQFLASGVFLTCWTNFGGVGYLVKHDLAEPAMIVCRSLVLDAIRLAYFAAHKDDLEKLAVRFTKLSVAQERGFLERARAAGVDIGERIDRLDGQEAELRSRADELGMTKISGLPKETDMAKEIASSNPGLHVALYSQVVHTNRVAIARRFRKENENSVEAKLTSDEPELQMVSDQANSAICNA